MPVTSFGDCSSISVGGHYTPSGFTSNVWDLASKLHKLDGPAALLVRQAASDIPLFGSDTVIDRSIGE